MQPPPIQTPFSDNKQIISQAWLRWFNIVGGSGYIDRGDPAAYDFTLASFTRDGTWRDLNLSAIIGTGPKLVHFFCAIWGTTAELGFQLRENGNANVYNVLWHQTQVANITLPINGFVLCDSSGIVEYNATNSAAWAGISLVVRGWLSL